MLMSSKTYQMLQALLVVFATHKSWHGKSLVIPYPQSVGQVWWHWYFHNFNNWINNLQQSRRNRRKRKNKRRKKITKKMQRKRIQKIKRTRRKGKRKRKKIRKVTRVMIWEMSCDIDDGTYFYICFIGNNSSSWSCNVRMLNNSRI